MDGAVAPLTMWDEQDLRNSRIDEDFRTPIGDEETATTALVRAIAAIENRDVTEIGPLFEGVDPEALDALCRNDPAVRVAFSTDGYYVIVREGELVVHPDDGMR